MADAVKDVIERLDTLRTNLRNFQVSNDLDILEDALDELEEIHDDIDEILEDSEAID